jgi:hypothetical protein
MTTMGEWLSALSPISGLALNATVQVASFRIRPSIGLLRSEYLGFAAGFACVAGIAGAAMVAPSGTGSPADAAFRALLSLCCYAALGYCHFHFVNLGETARRIRLLRELHEAGGALSHPDLVARYGAREIVERRIARLLGTGQVVLCEGRYHIRNPLVLTIARGMMALKMVLLKKGSEHDR